MSRYVLDCQEIDQTQVAVAGGKGAHLGELSRIDGIRVPAGYCGTTAAFNRIMAAGAFDDRLDRLSRLEPDDREAIRTLSTEIRRTVEGICTIRRASRRSWPGWKPCGGSTISSKRGWARRTRPARSRSPFPTTLHPRWGWRSLTSRT